MALVAGNRAGLRTSASRASPRAFVHAPTPVRPSYAGNSLAHVVRPVQNQRHVVASASARGLVVEANLFSRMVRIVRSYVNNFTSSFEDPEVMLDRVTDEMQEDLIRMRQTAARVMGSEKQMSAKFNQAQATADEWLRRAELAVRKGQDELGREALLRRKTYENTANSMRPGLEAQRKALEQLNANIRLLESKMQEARNKKETLKARAATAKSSKQVQEMVAGLRINTDGAWAAFDKMEEKVMAMEAEAEAVGVLATPDSIEQKFITLEAGGVEDELAMLKKGMLTASSSTRGGAEAASLGRPVSDVLVGNGTRVPMDAIDAELEQLRKRARQ